MWNPLKIVCQIKGSLPVAAPEPSEIIGFPCIFGEYVDSDLAVLHKSRKRKTLYIKDGSSRLKST